MSTRMKGIVIGDAMIPSPGFEQAWARYMADYGDCLYAGDFEPDWDQLQFRRLEVEKNGPDIEPCDPIILQHGAQADTLMGLFVPVSAAVMDAMPNLRLVGVCRAGLENVNLAEATKRGILVFHIMGRNAQAVSDFAIGMMLAESRNIARAHYAIKNGQWRKTFPNSDNVPELNEKTVGLVGFGYIGRLVARKLSGFNARVQVYDPYTDPAAIQAAGCTPVELRQLFSDSDFISLHARLTDENKGMINAELLSLMKPSSYLINTSRAGLLDQDALVAALQANQIAGAALDVFTTEPLEADSPYLALDNVTLTTHLAGTTEEALSRSPFLLMEDVALLLSGQQPRFIVNPEVLQDTGFASWLAGVQG